MVFCTPFHKPFQYQLDRVQFFSSIYLLFRFCSSFDVFIDSDILDWSLERWGTNRCSIRSEQQNWKEKNNEFVKDKLRTVLRGGDWDLCVISGKWILQFNSTPYSSRFRFIQGLKRRVRSFVTANGRPSAIAHELYILTPNLCSHNGNIRFFSKQEGNWTLRDAYLAFIKVCSTSIQVLVCPFRIQKIPNFRWINRLLMTLWIKNRMGLLSNCLFYVFFEIINSSDARPSTGLFGCDVGWFYWDCRKKLFVLRLGSSL